MKKIALPILNAKLSAHFGHPEHFYIYDVNEKEIVKETMLVQPEHKPGVYPAWLSDLGVTDIIVGGIGAKAIELFNQNGINVFAGAEIKSAKELVNDLINGTLICNENSCNNDSEHGHEHGHHHHN